MSVRFVFCLPPWLSCTMFNIYQWFLLITRTFWLIRLPESESKISVDTWQNLGLLMYQVCNFRRGLSFWIQLKLDTNTYVILIFRSNKKRFLTVSLGTDGTDATTPLNEIVGGFRFIVRISAIRTYTHLRLEPGATVTSDYRSVVYLFVKNLLSIKKKKEKNRLGLRESRLSPSLVVPVPITCVSASRARSLPFRT